MRSVILVWIGLAAGASAQAQPMHYYVTAETLNVRLCASTTCPVTNRLYRRNRVEVYETTSGWARISEYYDAEAERAEFPEITKAVVARWVAAKYLSQKQPPELAQPRFPEHLMDKRIQGIRKVGEFGLDEEDVRRLRKYAYQLINDNICSGVDYGDKSVHRANTYYVLCAGESRNRFFTPTDLE